MNDLISRQDAINVADAVWSVTGDKNVAKVWDQIKDLPSVQPEYRLDEWCTDCKEYDTEKHCCPRFNQVIRTTLNEMKSERKKGKWEYNAFADKWRCDQCFHSHIEQSNFCPNCGARMTEEEA